MRIALIGCSKEKLTHAAPARELYTSALFRAARTWAEAYADGWFVLSAKHGLVAPDTVIEPYDETLSTRGEERREWAERTSAAIVASVPHDVRIVVLAGERYQDAVFRVPHQWSFPLGGLEIGQRLAWFRRENATAALWARMREAAREGANAEFEPAEIGALLAERVGRAA